MPFAHLGRLLVGCKSDAALMPALVPGYGMVGSS
jgi:hypothetical protein